MPELPEVEIVRQSLQKKIKDKVIEKVLVKNRNLRFKIHTKFEKHLQQKKIKKVGRFSKYLIITFKDASGFIIHLGMSGTIHLCDINRENIFTNTSFYHSPILPKKHNHVEINFNKIKFIYNDPRRFGYFIILNSSIKLKSFINNYGIEPFNKNFNYNYVKSKLNDKKKI